MPLFAGDGRDLVVNADIAPSDSSLLRLFCVAPADRYVYA
jgi:hypothetical protein